jgi:endo-1,4-beta-xylanase
MTDTEGNTMKMIDTLALDADTFPELPLEDDLGTQVDVLPERPPLGHGLWRRATAVGICAVALLATACTGGEQSSEGDRSAPPASRLELSTLPEFDASSEQNLLTGNWHFTPGVTVKEGVLAVNHTSSATLTTPPEGQKTAKPGFIPNPVVTLYGPHIELGQKGNVGFSANLEGVQGAATISLLSSPNIRFDERVERQPGVDVTVRGDIADVAVWDGKSQHPQNTEVHLDKPVNGTAQIAVEQVDRQIVVAINGQKISPQPAVLGNQVWLGLNSKGSFNVTDFGVFPIKGTDQKVTIVDTAKQTTDAKPAPNGLASLAAAHGHKDKLIGTAVDLATLLSDPTYAEFVVQNFNEIETETLAKFQALQPEKGNFQFAELDALVDFANRHNLTVHGHALVFGEAYPEWLYNDLQKASKEEALEIMRTHIKTVVSRYDGKHGHGAIKFWDVVNEPFDPDEWGELNTSTIWYKAIGEDYILEAFKAAREANPDGVYGLNEWGIETDADRRGAVLRLLDGMPKGTIDFVGLQAHFDEDTLDDDEVMDGIYSGDLHKIFAEFAKRGVKVRISEASVAENGDPETQSDVYEMLLEACMKASNCLGFNLWGATSNRYYFTTTPEYGVGDDAPTKQDADNGKIIERPAMAGLRKGAAV